MTVALVALAVTFQPTDQRGRINVEYPIYTGDESMPRTFKLTACQEVVYETEVAAETLDEARERLRAILAAHMPVLVSNAEEPDKIGAMKLIENEGRWTILDEEDENAGVEQI